MVAQVAGHAGCLATRLRCDNTTPLWASRCCPRYKKIMATSPSSTVGAAAGPLASTPCQACKAMPAGTGACASGASPSQHSTYAAGPGQSAPGARLKTSRAADGSAPGPGILRDMRHLRRLEQRVHPHQAPPLLPGRQKLATTVQSFVQAPTPRAHRAPAPAAAKPAAQRSICACKSAYDRCCLHHRQGGARRPADRSRCGSWCSNTGVWHWVRWGA